MGTTNTRVQDCGTGQARIHRNKHGLVQLTTGCVKHARSRLQANFPINTCQRSWIEVAVLVGAFYYLCTLSNKYTTREEINFTK